MSKTSKLSMIFVGDSACLALDARGVREGGACERGDRCYGLFLVQKGGGQGQTTLGPGSDWQGLLEGRQSPAICATACCTKFGKRFVSRAVLEESEPTDSRVQLAPGQ